MLNREGIHDSSCSGSDCPSICAAINVIVIMINLQRKLIRMKPVEGEMLGDQREDDSNGKDSGKRVLFHRQN